MTREVILITLGILAIILIFVLIYTSNSSKKIEDPYGVLDHSQKLQEVFSKQMEVLREKEKLDKPIDQLELHQQTRIVGHRTSYFVTKVHGGFIYESMNGATVFVPHEESFKDKFEKAIKSEDFNEKLHKGLDHFMKRRSQKEEALLKRLNTPWFSNLYDLIVSEVTIFDQISDDDLAYHKDKYKITPKQFRRFVEIVNLTTKDTAPPESNHYEEIRVFKHLTVTTVCGQGCYTTISINKK